MEARALTRDPAKANLPGRRGGRERRHAGRRRRTRAALAGVDTLFLLNAGDGGGADPDAADAQPGAGGGDRAAGLLLGVPRRQAFATVPHFTAKHTAELMIEQLDIPATILRPELLHAERHLVQGRGARGRTCTRSRSASRGVSMVDARDVAEVAALAVLERRARSARAAAAPDHQRGRPGAADGRGQRYATWSELTGHGRSATAATTGCRSSRRCAGLGPSWAAMDMRLMLDRFVADGMRAGDDDVAEMKRLLGRTPRTYAEFAREALATWRAPA